MFSEELSEKLQALPTKSVKSNPVSLMGSYLEAAPKLIKLEDALFAIGQTLSVSELTGISDILKHFNQEINQSLRKLPKTKIKINPLKKYSKDNTLFIVEEYIELQEALENLQQIKPSLDKAESFIIETYFTLLNFKASRLPQLVKNDAQSSQLQGAPQDIEKATEIRQKYLNWINQNTSQLSATLADFVQNQAYQITSASWWLKNQEQTYFKVLAKINQNLDQEIYRLTTI